MIFLIHCDIRFVDLCESLAKCRSSVCRNKHIGVKEKLNPAALAFVKQVVVFDNKSTSDDASTETMENDSGENESGTAFLMRILRYLETPQYLRKSLFPKHNSLRYVVSIYLYVTDFGIESM